MAPMRDGVRLNTHIFRAARTRSPELPIMLERTPYQAPAGEALGGGEVSRRWRRMATSSSSRIFAGATGSEGQFVYAACARSRCSDRRSRS
jgi:predicted acyl esterase